MIDNIQLCGYDIPNPIQSYIVPAVVRDHDEIATSQTGSNETAAFLVTIISKLMGKVQELAARRPALIGVVHPDLR